MAILLSPVSYYKTEPYTQPMNILYYLGSFPKLSESFVLNEIYELERRGYDVVVCALNEPDNQFVHEEFNKVDVPIEYVPTPTYSDALTATSPKFLQHNILKEMMYLAPPADHVTNLFRTKHCLTFIDSIDWTPDHIHTHFATLSKFPAAYMSAYYGVPFTLTAHAWDIYKRPIGRYTTNLMRSADRIITISEYNRDWIRNQFTPDTPIDIVHAGIRPGKFTPTTGTEPNRVVTIARFVEKKGLEYALDAIASVARQIPDIEYNLIGSGEQRDALVQKVQKLELEDTVTFLDDVCDQRLITELDQARCFLLPCVIAENGDRDGIPVSIMEAMAMKTPPVSTTISGIPELVDHEQNGLLTDPGDADLIADAIITLLQNDSLYERYAQRGRETVRAEFNITTEAEKLETVFQNASQI